LVASGEKARGGATTRSRGFGVTATRSRPAAAARIRAEVESTGAGTGGVAKRLGEIIRSENNAAQRQKNLTRRATGFAQSKRRTTTMGMRVENDIANWREEHGIRLPSAEVASVLTDISEACYQLIMDIEHEKHADGLSGLSEQAYRTIKLIEHELSGIRDGNGCYHGSDPIGGSLFNYEPERPLTSRLVKLCRLLDRMQQQGEIYDLEQKHQEELIDLAEKHRIENQRALGDAIDLD
jgi:hypothetical protein